MFASTRYIILMIRRFVEITLVLSVLLVLSCQGSIGERLAGKQFAFGKAGKIAVLADTHIWDQHPGDTMQYYYGSAFPILPQPEPLFDLQHHTFEDLIQNPIRKQLRSYVILANMSDTESPVTKTVEEDLGNMSITSGYAEKDYQFRAGMNKWAENQLVLYIIGKNESGLIDGIKASLPTFSKRLYDFDKIQYEANLFLSGHSVTIENKLNDEYGIEMNIPDRFQIGIDKKPFLWLQDITPKITSGIIFYHLPYKDRTIFSEEHMIALRDSLTKANISSTTPKSYMEINNVDLPTFYYSRDINGNYTNELRGIWDMKNEFMGGAFATFLIHNSIRNEVLFVDVFVYGPGHTKREAMKQLIYLVEDISLIKG